MKRYLVYNIKWDREVDGEIDNNAILPEHLSLSIDETEEAEIEEVIGDYLSDNYAFCVKSFEYERLGDQKGYILHFRQTVCNIESPLARYWRCDADSYDHAVEQLKDEIEHAQGEKVVFVELIGTKI